jgi:hypothetical protein
MTAKDTLSQLELLLVRYEWAPGALNGLVQEHADRMVKRLADEGLKDQIQFLESQGLTINRIYAEVEGSVPF